MQTKEHNKEYGRPKEGRCQWIFELDEIELFISASSQSISRDGRRSEDEVLRLLFWRGSNNGK